MKNLFLDTNIVIDFVFQREGFFENAKSILALGLKEDFSLFTSALTFVTTLYVSKHYHKSVQQTKESLLSLLQFINVVDLSSQNVIENLSRNWSDYEDSTQEYCAKVVDADVIITRNVNDFKDSEICVQTPLDFISQLG